MSWRSRLRAISDTTRPQYDGKVVQSQLVQHHVEAAAQLTVTEKLAVFVPNSAAHVSLNSLHFAACYSLVFRLVGTHPIAVLQTFQDARSFADYYDVSSWA